MRTTRAQSEGRAGTVWAARRSLAIALALCLVLTGLAWFTLGALEDTIRSSIRNTGATYLQTIEEALHLWLDQRRTAIETLARSRDVVEATEALVAPGGRDATPPPASAFGRLQDVLDRQIDAYGDLGFAIIGPDRITIASTRAEDLGRRHVLAAQEEALLDRAFAGETVAAVGVRSAETFLSNGGELPPGYPITYVASPVRRDDGATLGVIAVAIHPGAVSRVTELGRFLTTAETYAFDRDGRFLTSSRFENDLVAGGLLEPGQESFVALWVCERSGTGAEPRGAGLGDRPLTVAAASAIRERTGGNNPGYRNYRGAEVWGHWLWDDDLGIGLVVEIDREEALLPYHQARPVLLAILAATAGLSIAASLAIGRTAKDRRSARFAEELSRTRSALFANLGHEIRTPMNGVIGMTELVLNSTLASEQREALETVHSSAESLLRLLNDVMDSSRLEAEQCALESRPFDLHAMVMSVLRASAVSAQARGNELVLDFESGVPHVVAGDSLRVRQILTNLLSNAIRFTENGDIEISVSPGVRDDGRSSVRFTVRDTGIGISAGQIDRIWSDFTPAEVPTSSRRSRGSGLGLSISRRLVELMGGRFEVHSREGQGSAVSFAIPLDQVGTGVAVSDAEFDGRTALVVDDNAASRAVLGRILAGAGMRVQEAGSADQARMCIQSGSGGRPFDVALVDLRMPGKSGFELIESLDDGQRMQTILIAMASSTMAGDSQRAKKLGARGIVSKPVSGRDLRNQIAKAFSDRTMSVDAHACEDSVPNAATRKLKVLLAEDNSVNQRVAKGMLEARGHSVDIVGNGRAAVSAVRTNPYDVVLMDIQMPELDGYQAARQIRAMPRFDSLPIVAVTALAMLEHKQKSVSAGMNGFLTKPFRANELMACVEGFRPGAPL